MLDNNGVYFFIMILSIIISGVVSFSETTVLSSNRNYILGTKKYSFLKSITISIIEQKDRVVTLILIINTLANVVTSICITTLSVRTFHSSALVFASFFSTILLLIFGEIFPKIIAMKNPNQFIFFISPFIYLLLKIFFPILLIIEFFLKIIFFILRIKESNQATKFSKEIKEIVSAYKISFNKASSYFENDQTEKKYIKMIHAISRLNEITVEQIITHRLKVSYIDIQEDDEEIKKKILNSKHSRILVCDGDIDNIIGVLHIKEIIWFLFEKKENTTFNFTKDQIIKLASEPIFILENTPLLTQLENFEINKKHFAIVINEYSVMSGIVTLTDIMEEIIGNIYDEYDIHKSRIKNINENTFILHGSLPMHEFLNEFDIDIDESNEYATLAGFLIEQFGYIPKESEEIIINNYIFKILLVEKNIIKKIELYLK